MKNKEIQVLNTRELTPLTQSVKSAAGKKYLDAEIINEIISSVKNPKHAFLFTFLWMTGVRTTEAISIRRKDIDLNNNEINIRWLKNRKYHNRVISLNPQIKPLLAAFISKLNYDEILFPYSRQWAYMLVERHFKVPGHALRHSFAVHFLRNCDSPHGLVTLKNILGHGRIETTMEYLKLVPKDQFDLLKKIKF